MKYKPQKKKYDKIYSIKIKNFCSPTDTIKSISMQAVEREKIFAMHIYDKELNFRYTQNFSYN